MNKLREMMLSRVTSELAGGNLRVSFDGVDKPVDSKSGKGIGTRNGLFIATNSFLTEFCVSFLNQDQINKAEAFALKLNANASKQ